MLYIEVSRNIMRKEGEKMLILKGRIALAESVEVFGLFGSMTFDNRRTALVVRNKIVETLLTHREVVLDFKNIAFVSDAFIDITLGSLLRQYGPRLLRRMVIINYNPSVKATIRLTLCACLDDWLRSTTKAPPLTTKGSDYSKI